MRKEDFGLEGANLKLFPQVGLPWPLDDIHAIETPSKIRFDGLLPRECEALIYMDWTWPPGASTSPQFLDVNPNMARTLGSHVCEENGMPVNTEGSGPWKLGAPTQVGSGTMVVRYRLVGAERSSCSPRLFGIRMLEAWESMRLIGFSDDFWPIGKLPEMESWTLDDLSTFSNMAGNAYSAHSLSLFLFSIDWPD